jgi:hypothetical protein
MPETITGFNVFTPGTKAKATQVNTNFATRRGTFLPMKEDTATASHQEHDLGNSSYYWRSIYLKNPPFINGVQASRFEVPILVAGEVPPDDVDDVANQSLLAFPRALDTDVRFSFMVPQDYAPGNRISLLFGGYSETSPGFRIQTEAALYKNGVTRSDTSVAANVATSTVDITSPTTAGLYFQNSSLRLTDASGLINGVTVTANDEITVNFKRKGSNASDTMAGYFYLKDLVVDLNL